MSITATLTRQGALAPPDFLIPSVRYETLMGSVAYGVSQDRSDMDIYGFCIPPAPELFPHLKGYIPGFGESATPFEQFQEHHVRVPGDSTVYDVVLYSIVRFVSLCMENNPNMIEALFTPQHCVLHTSPAAERLRQARGSMLHKGLWPKFRGFTMSQLHKMHIKKPRPKSKRAALVEAFGYDVKFAYHAVRLLDFADQMLTSGDLDMSRKRDALIDIRQGAWTQAQLVSYCDQEIARLDEVCVGSALPDEANEEAVRGVLLECLEEEYGSLKGIVF